MAQSLSSVLIHLVFSTKHRERWITPEVEPDMHRYIAIVFRACESPALLIGGDRDHIHALFALGRTITLAEVVREVKSSSSHWLKGVGSEFRAFQWQIGYGAFSVGRSQVAALRRYIAAQKEHHRQRSFEDELRGLLKKYELNFDEERIWD
jgi:REP element-mobilizing transposase RayT